MVKCCACSSNGRCKACSCIKNRRKCLDCVPSKHSRCENFTLPGAAEGGQATSSQPLRRGTPGFSCSKVSHSSSRSSFSPSCLSSSCPPLLPSSSSLTCPLKSCAFPKLPAAHAPSHARRGTGATGLGRGTADLDTTTSPSCENSVTTCANVHNCTVIDQPGQCANADFPQHSSSSLTSPLSAHVNPDTDGWLPPNLPSFDRVAEPNFRWGALTGEEFTHVIHRAYS